MKLNECEYDLIVWYKYNTHSGLMSKQYNHISENTLNSIKEQYIKKHLAGNYESVSFECYTNGHLEGKNTTVKYEYVM